MKIQTIALAAALALGGSAFAATSASSNGKPHHATAGKHVKHVAKAGKHHHHMARRADRHNDMTTRNVTTDINSGSRETRMGDALQKFRSHS